MLDHGFTSAYSAASAKLRIDVVIRNAIEAGELPGPRMRACGPEIAVTGGLGDERRAHQFRDSFAMFAEGPVEVTKLARLCVRAGIEPGLAAASRAYPEMKRRFIRVVIGGDYGFARTPQGENARDIAHCVRHLGYNRSEALVGATRYGAELMGLGDAAGQVRESFLADLLLVDGDPVADVSVLQHKERLVA